jgi:hypothetical protein
MFYGSTVTLSIAPVASELLLCAVTAIPMYTLGFMVTETELPSWVQALAPSAW